MDNKELKKTIIKNIANREYYLFVVNNYAAGIQQKNGKYLTKYFPLSPFVLEQMIMQNGSMGCYQQRYKTGQIRWICFDFDCKDKENPAIEEMYKECILPFTEMLKELNIHYLTEFSGRRGIHIWIVFNSLISKKTGYLILNELEKRCPFLEGINNSEKWNLDRFPATDSSIGNTVGKQVKFPLSSHKSGSRSYFFLGEFCTINDTSSIVFFKSQFDILDSYNLNNAEEIITRLDLNKESIQNNSLIYEKYNLIDDIELTPQEVIDILSETKVFKQIFERMKMGHGMHQDWVVLLGTLSVCDLDLLKNVLKKFPDFDETQTQYNILKLKDKYYPAKFAYLYRIYNMEIEEGLNENETSLYYLLKRCGLEKKLLKKYDASNEVSLYNDLRSTVNKEMNYLRSNDEVANVQIWNDLCRINSIDLYNYEKEINKILENDGYDYTPVDYKVFKRIESNEKIRYLVSLSAKDRIITTNLAIQLCYAMKRRWNSFSYQISYTSKNSIFFYWYSSWSNFINHIRVFTDITFMENFQVFYIDLKEFYNNIDFLNVFRTIKDSLNDESENIFMFLTNYNDKLMKSIQEGNRIGVPQGPAYARIIAELYLDELLDRAISKYRKEELLYIYRYVDDMVVFCAPNVDGNKIFNDLIQFLTLSSLPINTNKSKYYGFIRNLTIEEKKDLLHDESFNYDLNGNLSISPVLEIEKWQRTKKYFAEHPFNIKALGYFFGKHTFLEAQKWCLEKFDEVILKSIEGRGSSFRSFYNFLFNNEKYMINLLDNNKLKLIQVNSLNFSNFIHELYYSIQSNTLHSDLFERIKKEYLAGLNTEELCEDDRIIVNALLEIKMEKSNGKD